MVLDAAGWNCSVALNGRSTEPVRSLEDRYQPLRLRRSRNGCVVAAIEAGGGRQRSALVIINAEQGYLVPCCEDPWGTTMELCSHPYPPMSA